MGDAIFDGSTSVIGGRLYRWTGQAWALASAASGGNLTGGGLLGVAMATGTASSVGMMLRGWVMNSTYWESDDQGSPIYASTVAGNVTQTKPTETNQIVRIVGYASASEFGAWFCPDNTYIKLS